MSKRRGLSEQPSDNAPAPSRRSARAGGAAGKSEEEEEGARHRPRRQRSTPAEDEQGAASASTPRASGKVRDDGNTRASARGRNLHKLLQEHGQDPVVLKRFALLGKLRANANIGDLLASLAGQLFDEVSADGSQIVVDGKTLSLGAPATQTCAPASPPRRNDSMLYGAARQAAEDTYTLLSLSSSPGCNTRARACGSTKIWPCPCRIT